MNWIKSIRTKLGLTQDQFAKSLNVTITTISRWENNVAKPNGYLKERLLEIQKRVTDE
jgi:DNA-binding transcriptional regulator YiaG